jgi:hypothetical protein
LKNCFEELEKNFGEADWNFDLKEASPLVPIVEQLDVV